MDARDRDSRFFGIFGLSLAVGGLLIPFVVYGISGEDASGGFLVVSQLLALTFSIIGRKSKPGFVGLIISAAAVALLLVMLLLKAG